MLGDGKPPRMPDTEIEGVDLMGPSSPWGRSSVCLGSVYGNCSQILT